MVNSFVKIPLELMVFSVFFTIEQLLLMVIQWFFTFKPSLSTVLSMVFHIRTIIINGFSMLFLQLSHCDWMNCCVAHQRHQWLFNGSQKSANCDIKPLFVRKTKTNNCLTNQYMISPYNMIISWEYDQPKWRPVLANTIGSLQIDHLC